MERAHEIEQRINERAATRNVDDSELADFVEDDEGEDEESEGEESGGEEEEDIEVVEKPPAKKAKVRAVKLETPLPPHIPSTTTANRRPCQSTGLEVLTQISSSLDPATQAARDADCAAQSHQ